VPSSGTAGLSASWERVEVEQAQDKQVKEQAKARKGSRVMLLHGVRWGTQGLWGRDGAGKVCGEEMGQARFVGKRWGSQCL